MLARWTLLLRRLALVLGLYSILRVFFLLCNYAVFHKSAPGQLALAFFQGLRFDLSAVVAINFIFILLVFLPRRAEPAPKYQKLCKWIFIALNVPFLFLNVADLEYFQ